MRSGEVIRYEGKRGAVWRLRYRDASGRRVRETLGPEPPWSERKAEAELRRRLVAVDDGWRKPEALTFDAFADRFENEFLPGRGLKKSTLTDYGATLRLHLRPFFGDRPLASIEPRDLDAYIAAKAKRLSPKTISNHLGLLRLMFKIAARWRLIGRNPALDVDSPRVLVPEMQVLSVAEIAALEKAYAEKIVRASEAERRWWQLAQTLVFVALGTALRRGELLALRWRDISFLDGTLRVREAWVAGEFTTPKSRTSRRTIEVGPQTLALLQEQWQRSAFRGDGELVFGHPQKGTPLDPSKLSRDYLRPALKLAGITRPFRPWHDLRHTALTHEAAAGNPQTYVQLKAGHSQGAITERYIHAAQVLFPGAAARAEDRMFSGLAAGSTSRP
jgi:integrase